MDFGNLWKGHGFQLWRLALGVLNTIKSVISGTSGTEGFTDIAIFHILNIIRDMYLSVPSYLMDRPNHVTCHLISCPVYHAALPSPFHH
jgi:hypothetical protein